MPPTLDEMALKDHPVRLVVAFDDALDREDWVEMGVDINVGRTGGYGFTTGVRSSRKLEGAGVAPGLLGDGPTRVSGTASLT